MVKTDEVLKTYSCVNHGEQVLCGHIFEKFLHKYGSFAKIAQWATLENAKSGFPEVTLSSVRKLSDIYKKRNVGKNFPEFEIKCKLTAHTVSKSATTKSSIASKTLSAATLSAATLSTAAETLYTADATLSAGTTTLSCEGTSMNLYVSFKINFKKTRKQIKFLIIIRRNLSCLSL